MSAELIGTLAANGLMGAGANVSLLVGSYGIARYGFMQSRGISVGLATAVVFWVACTVGLGLLGTIGALAVGPMLAWGVVVMAMGTGLWWFRTGVGDHGSLPPAPVEPLAWDAVFSLALLLSAALVLAMRSLIWAVKVVSDGPIYHLYFAARWWKAGRLFLVATPFGENAATYFPANGDLWFTWLMASWDGDRLAKIGQAPFFVLALVASYACARRLGAGRSASAVATCWFASSSALLLFSFEANVDTIFAAGYLTAAFFFLKASQDDGDTSADWCLGALAAGEALGTKAVGVVFVPPLIAVALVAILRQAVPPRTKIMQSAVIAFAVMVSGGFWYVRNAFLTGNPLYPLEVRLFGQTLLHGWYAPDAMASSPFYLAPTDWRALGDILLSVFDPRLAPLWLAAIAGGWAVKRGGDDGTRLAVALFSLGAVVNIALYWVCIPYRTQQRFMLHAMGLAVVPLAITLDWSRWLRRAAAVLLSLHLLTPQGWPFERADRTLPWDLTPSIPNSMEDPAQTFSRFVRAFRLVGWNRSALGLALMIAIILSAVLMVGLVRGGPVRRGRNRSRIALVVAAAALFLGLGYLDVWRDLLDPRLRIYPPFPEFYAGWLQLDARSGSAGTRVAYTGTNIPYYLMASGLRNDVRYINIDRHRDWLLHDYHRDAMKQGKGIWPNSRPGWDRMAPDFQAWVDNLEAAGIQLLVVTRVNPNEGPHNVADSEGFPVERRWADSHPEWFQPLYGEAEHDTWFRLYRFRRGRSGRLAESGQAPAR